MELTLKQARRLEQSISAAVQAKVSNMHSDMKVTKYNVDQLEAKIAAGATKLMAMFGEIDILIDIRYDIRRAIELMNEESGLNLCMNIEEKLKAKRTFLQLVGLMAPVSDEDIVVIRARLENVELKQSEYGAGWNDTQALNNVLTQEVLDDKKSELRDVMRQITTIADNSAMLNSSKKIVISDDSAATLKEAGLI